MRVFPFPVRQGEEIQWLAKRKYRQIEADRGEEGRRRRIAKRKKKVVRVRG